MTRTPSSSSALSACSVVNSSPVVGARSVIAVDDNPRRFAEPIDARKRGLVVRVDRRQSARIVCPNGDEILIHKSDNDNRRVMIDAAEGYRIDRVEPRRREATR